MSKEKSFGAAAAVKDVESFINKVKGKAGLEVVSTSSMAKFVGASLFAGAVLTGTGNAIEMSENIRAAKQAAATSQSVMTEGQPQSALPGGPQKIDTSRFSRPPEVKGPEASTASRPSSSRETNREVSSTGRFVSSRFSRPPERSAEPERRPVEESRSRGMSR